MHWRNVWRCLSGFFAKLVITALLIDAFKKYNINVSHHNFKEIKLGEVLIKCFWEKKFYVAPYCARCRRLCTLSKMCTPKSSAKWTFTRVTTYQNSGTTLYEQCFCFCLSYNITCICIRMHCYQSSVKIRNFQDNTGKRKTNGVKLWLCNKFSKHKISESLTFYNFFEQ